MKRIILLMAVLVWGLGATQAQKPKIVTAAQANGTYSARNGEIRILALGQNKLRVQLDVFYEYKSPGGPTANLGFADGTAIIENDVATFQPPDTTGCTITLKFLAGNKLKVTQKGSDSDCGFGHNVYANGTYRKTKRGKPKFDENR